MLTMRIFQTFNNGIKYHTEMRHIESYSIPTYGYLIKLSINLCLSVFFLMAYPTVSIFLTFCASGHCFHYFLFHLFLSLFLSGRTTLYKLTLIRITRPGSYFLTVFKFWATKTKYTQQNPNCVMQRNVLIIVLETIWMKNFEFNYHHETHNRHRKRVLG